ncbi:response regulator transcription factor [Cupriavidus oxalaticus]|uniref:response regulator transcription factor n=1 Tax=Cupriavidus oxalaticus TaxID=96344 RepID=UPI00316F1ED5
MGVVTRQLPQDLGAAMTGNTSIYVVDDDFRVREAIAELLLSAGFCVTTFACAGDYLAHARADLRSCLILDVELPDISGLDLQSQLDCGSHPPIIFVTGFADVPRSVRACKAGAVDFITKPFREAQLLEAVAAALKLDDQRRVLRRARQEIQDRFAQLTPREREVLPLVTSGLLNKQAASELGISMVTLQIHRQRVMCKMQARSLPDLVRMADMLDIPVVPQRRES